MLSGPLSAALRALAVCACLLGAASGAAGQADWGRWAEEARKQHPLAGSFYWPRQGPLWESGHGEGLGVAGRAQLDDDGKGRLYRPLSPDGRGPILTPPANIFLLGEVHDNPMHHRLRAWLIENRPARSTWGAVVFEHIRTDQQSALDQFKALGEAGKGTADDLLRLLEWDKSGWPPASIYTPLFETVIATRLPILAGDTPRDRIKAVARQGLPALAPEERTRLRLDTPLPEPLSAALSQELADSHCGALPPQAMDGMAAAQRYRDAHLADALLAAEQRHGSAVLIAGNGHVRSDRGVPWHIRQRKPDARVMSVVLVEVEDGKNEPAAYLPRDPDGKPAADLLIFTPRAERADPCESFRKKESAPPRPQ
jgi:uncharacterized iron-regulated protein